MNDIMAWVRFVLTAVCLACGFFFLLTGVIGQFRFDYVLNRMHAASMGDSLGLMLICIGLCISSNDGWLIGKMLLIALFLWVTSPTASHQIARLEYTTAPDAAEHMEVIKK